MKKYYTMYKIKKHNVNPNSFTKTNYEKSIYHLCLYIIALTVLTNTNVIVT